MGIKNKRRFADRRSIVDMVPLLFILAMLMLQLVLPNRTFSKEEQRYLTQLPTLSIEKVLNGSYGIKFESYFSDQFPFRNFWVNIKQDSDKVLFKR